MRTDRHEQQLRGKSDTLDAEDTRPEGLASAPAPMTHSVADDRDEGDYAHVE